jgi:hypothetical protein
MSPVFPRVLKNRWGQVFKNHFLSHFPEKTSLFKTCSPRLPGIERTLAIAEFLLNSAELNRLQNRLEHNIDIPSASGAR